MADLGEKGAAICARADAAFNAKASLNSFWQQTAELFYPERADFTSSKTAGEAFASSLYSGEQVLFRRDFANYLGSVLRPKGAEWFNIITDDDDLNDEETVRDFLQHKTKRTRSLLYSTKSNFVRAMVAGDHDYVTFGNSVTSINERTDQRGFRFRTWHLRDCAWLENDDGDVDTMFRKFSWSVRNLVSHAKGNKWDLHPNIRTKLSKNPDDKVNLMHVCMPLWNYDWERKKKKFDWISLYVDRDNKWICSDKEVGEFNYVVSRWFTIDGSPYGFSPAVVCSIPDARTLQSMVWSIMEAGEKAVEPPLIGVHEAILGGVDIRAGHVTWADKNYDERTGEVLRALDMGSQPQFGEAMREKLTQVMNAAWYLNKLFLPMEGPQMTAEEVARRHEEYLRTALPIIDPAEPERNGKTLDIVVNMAARLGYWGNPRDNEEPWPEELSGADLAFEYDNPIEQARKSLAAKKLGQALQMTAGVMQLFPQNPEYITAFDVKEAYEDALEGLVDQEWIKDEQDAEAEGEQAQQAVGEQQAMAQGMGLAEINKSLAEAQAAQAKAQPKAA